MEALADRRLTRYTVRFARAGGRRARPNERVHVLMHNCYRDYAVRNARQLAGLLAQPRAEAAPATPSAASR